jgi:hypothetical protein
MLTALFDAKGLIYHEFVPEKRMVSGQFYKEMFKRLIAGVHRVRPGFQESRSWYLLHDNAPAHSPSFWRNGGSPCYPIHPTPLIYRRLTFYIS